MEVKGPHCIRQLRTAQGCHHLSRVSALHRLHQGDGPVLYPRYAHCDRCA